MNNIFKLSLFIRDSDYLVIFLGKATVPVFVMGEWLVNPLPRFVA